MKCGNPACRKEINSKVAELTSWLLRTLGPVRRDALLMRYDEIPEVLCPDCFISTGDMVNLIAFSNEKGKISEV